jgi:glycosyltransferase involved in cell wall biosynthesis
VGLEPLVSSDPVSISVVISTFERPRACERALRSALNQLDPPLEVLVCDNGSHDETRALFSEWQQRDPRVRYLRIDDNTGTPASTRNLGAAHARGAWVAFLDDDDEWLAHKLSRQRELMSERSVDVIATNALRSDGSAYFPDAPALAQPQRDQLLRANPVITSSAMVRRELVRFPEARWLRGVEDYAAWLRLADAGARFAILGEPLVRYEDTGAERLSRDHLRSEWVLCGLAWLRTTRRPLDLANARAALRQTAGLAYVAGSELAAAVRASGRRR